MQEVHKIDLDSLGCRMHTAEHDMHDRPDSMYELATK